MPPVVRAESEMLLEIAMTNTSDKDVPYGVIAGWPAWSMFQIDLHDSAGNLIPETPLGKRIHDGPLTASVFSAPLAPGKALRPIVMLNWIYDLGRPGDYTVQARRMDQSSGMEVKSNILTFRIPLSAPPSRPGNPTISIAITSPFESVSAGWQIPIEISVKNLSRRGANLAVWNGQNQDATSKEPDEFGFGLEVRDGHGNPVALTKEGQAIFKHEELPTGYFAFVPLPPGEMVEETRVLGGICDIRSPGLYSIQVVLNDPTTNLPVRSNAIRVEVNESAPVHPAFVITISQDEALTTDRRFGLRLCQTNISNHRIKLDNYTFEQEISLRDSQGLPVPWNEKGKRTIKEGDENFHRGDRGVDASHLWDLAPGGNLCGVITLDGFGANDTSWDISKPGKYSIQVIRFDYPDKAPEQRMEELPKVKTNTITWVFSPESSMLKKAGGSSIR
ncbi:MAG TPA: hypothetical protein VGM18_19215 [Candidatus Sulfotelmatobacter sp.]|jgi:hypothetical protein